MHGLLTRAAAWPSPLRLAVRIAAAAVLVLLVPVHAIEHVVITPLIPLHRTIIQTLDNRFVVSGVGVNDGESLDPLRFRVKLSRPLKVGATTLYPVGWPSTPAGGYQQRGELPVNYSVTWVWPYLAASLVLILAWPASRVKELASRFIVWLLLAVVFVLLDVPIMVLGGTCVILYGAFDPDAWPVWIVLSAWLVGGGGFVLSILMAVISIVAVRAPTRSAAP